MKLDKKFITLQRKAERMARMGENTVARNYKKLLDELRITMGAMYQEYGIDGQLTFEEMTKYDRLQKLDKKVYELVTSLYKANTKVVKGTLIGIAKDAYNSSVAIAEGSTQKKLKGIIKPLDVGKTINNEMAGLKWTERMGKHRTDAIYEVKKEIKLGLTQGDTYGTMAKRLKDTLETDVKKANTIVRTEGHRVHAQAKKDSLDSIAKHGVRMTKKWLSGQDERVRSQHNDMNGVVIPYEDDFVMPDGAKGPSPGLIGQPQHDIHCRCIQTIDIVTDEEKSSYSIYLTDDEEFALNTYVSSESYKINEKLRNDIDLSEDDRKLINYLDSALDKVETYKGDLSRSYQFYDEEELSNFLKEHSINNRVKYKGYTSTTIGEIYNPEGQVQTYILDSKKGKNIVKYNTGEQEVLYKRDSEFTVKAVEELNGTYHILLEEL